MIKKLEENVQKKLNYEFYSDNDYYSDGDTAENRLLKIVKIQSDFDEYLIQNTNYADYYHLSRDREAIIDGMEINENDDVLEIGAGCGALTGAIARKAGHVTCIELSKRRSEINAYKNYECENIEIIVANYENVIFKKKYDVITLIGVFEYAELYIHSDNPYCDFLTDAYSKLKKGGRLYIAIENKLGAKYFSGCVEDHTARSFDGIEGYTVPQRVRTFSYFEWKKMLDKCGIQNYYFMYPYPDYKFPSIIYSDYFLPKKGTIFAYSNDYGKNRRRYLFNENEFLNHLCIEEEYRIFANSFLICIKR